LDINASSRLQFAGPLLKLSLTPEIQLIEW
jgi:hypothetical protein